LEVYLSEVWKSADAYELPLRDEEGRQRVDQEYSPSEVFTTGASFILDSSSKGIGHLLVKNLRKM